MKHIISGTVIALMLMIATPATAEVGGTITRQVSAQSGIDTVVMMVLELFTWESNIGSITLDNGTYSASADCNLISGSYSIKGNTIDFGEPISTLMYCEGKMENEAALISSLVTATTMSFKDGKLVLSNSTSTISFTPTFGVASNATKTIEDKKWQLVELDGERVKGTADDYFITFKSEDTTYSAKAGCNSIGGKYAIVDQFKFEVSDGYSTEMACSDMVTELSFIKNLELADNFTVSADGTELSLNKAKMAPLMRFELVK